jgi:hypothetical protein
MPSPDKFLIFYKILHYPEYDNKNAPNKNQQSSLFAYEKDTQIPSIHSGCSGNILRFSKKIYIAEKYKGKQDDITKPSRLDC